MGAIGVAILSKKEKEIDFNFDIGKNNYLTTSTYCKRCPNNCEIIMIRKDKELIDSWGNRCEKGTIRK